MIGQVLRAGAGISVAAALLALSAAEGHSIGNPGMVVAITAVPGYAGHAFVYAQVSDSTSTYPAPTGSGHQSPYYASWTRQPFGSSSCPWIWAVYVYDRATDRQINAPPPSAPQPNFGTTTSLCASPGTTPVEEPPVTEATARLDLDLQVSLAPRQPVAGTPAVLSAMLDGALTQDLNLYLNMAIEDWSVTRWRVDFGDGATASIAGQAASRLNLPHTYSSAGVYDARVVALIAGHAQAARYDPYGAVHLVRQPFSVEIGNDTSATARAAPTRAYVPPVVEAIVSPALEGSAPGPTAFRHVDALRGALTQFAVHLLVSREGLVRIGGATVGAARSRLLRWRYDGVPSDAPRNAGTIPGIVADAATLLRLQWNVPDLVSGHQLQDYTVRLTLYVESRFQDGHVAVYAIASYFLVTVDFAAESG
ncbi:MAG: hypothetical protein ABI401_10605 [Candidatus Dormibacter sp.]